MTHLEALKFLDLSEPFGPNELRRAFRGKALEYHPDRNSSEEAPRLFGIAVEAYELLVTCFSPEINLPKKVQIENLQDIFDDIFGYSEENRILGARAPNSIELSLVEYAFGYHRLVDLEAYVVCEGCQGSGAQKNSKSQLCTYCFGGGKIRVGDGVERFCPKCNALGRLIEHHCQHCAGFGRLPERRQVSLNLKPGLKLNEFLAHSVEDPKKGGRIDLFLKPQLKESKFFTIEKEVLVCHVVLPFEFRKKDCEAEIPTLWGKIKVLVPASEQQSLFIYLDAYGLPKKNNMAEGGEFKISISYDKEKIAKKWVKKMAQEMEFNNPYYKKEQNQSWWQKIWGA